MEYPIQVYLLLGFFTSVAIAVAIGYAILRFKRK
jgi:hypothetical protein